jgi:hypothetical protein
MILPTEGDRKRERGVTVSGQIRDFEVEIEENQGQSLENG